MAGTVHCDDSTSKVERPSKGRSESRTMLTVEKWGAKKVSESKVRKFFAPHVSTDSFYIFVRTKRHQKDTAFVRIGSCKLSWDFLF